MPEVSQKNLTLPLAGDISPSGANIFHPGQGVLGSIKMDEGWIKLHRKITEWEWYDDPIVFKVFIHLLLTVNHKDKKWHGVDVKRGQIITSTNNLALTLNFSRQQVRTALAKLQKTGEINQQTTSRYSLITICNYTTYQNENNATNQQLNHQATSKQPSSNQQLTTTKECKNVKNEKKRRAKPFVAPSKEEWIAYCKDKGFEHIADRSYEYYSSGDWCDNKGNKIKNWKQKLISVWFDENRNPKPKSDKFIPDDYDGPTIEELRAMRRRDVEAGLLPPSPRDLAMKKEKAS